MKPIIEITGLGKKYPIVHDKAPYGTLRDTIVNFIKHPFSSRKTRESFWALKDINLTINRGDIIGIIGKNGAGKSTLLKILSGITKPTEGKVKLYGRVSSLLEVGTGFHPELTGRENIYLNGVILGMTRKEVSKKFDEIVAFAGIEKFLDTPVKHYSSGMYVRLAFAIAAHLEPDILIVDEVLAVGDTEFQKKCLGKMESVSKEEGRTVIFVTHDLDTLQAICKKAVLLDSGQTKNIDLPEIITKQYLNLTLDQFGNNVKYGTTNTNGDVIINKVSTFNYSGEKSNQFYVSSGFIIKINFEVLRYIPLALVSIIFKTNNKIIYVVSDQDKNLKLREYVVGKYETIVNVPKLLFNPGYYNIEINIQKPDAVGATKYAEITNIPIHIITCENTKTLLYGGRVYGYFGINIDVNTKIENDN